MVWKLFGGLAAGATYLVGRNVVRRSQQHEAARAAGLTPGRDLIHLPVSLQHTALWSLSDGGVERRVVHGTFARSGGDVGVTAFDLETLRDRRGEWAWLPIDAPFRIGGLVSVVVCELDRDLPHVLFKRAGHGDELSDDGVLDRAMNVAKQMRDRLGMKRSYESEMPASLPRERYAAGLPAQWRAYTRAPELLDQLIAAGFAATLEASSCRDLVVELVGRLVVIYPAARDLAGADAFADLTSTALAIVDGLLAASPRLTPRGVDVTRL